MKAKIEGIGDSPTAGFSTGPKLVVPTRSHGKMSTQARVHAFYAKRAKAFEDKHGKGDEKEKEDKVKEHLAERPTYYVELARMIDPDNKIVRALTPKQLIKAANAGPFIGPHGGKWADPEHTIPYESPHYVHHIGSDPDQLHALVSKDPAMEKEIYEGGAMERAAKHLGQTSRQPAMSREELQQKKGQKPALPKHLQPKPKQAPQAGPPKAAQAAPQQQPQAPKQGIQPMPKRDAKYWLGDDEEEPAQATASQEEPLPPVQADPQAESTDDISFTPGAEPDTARPDLNEEEPLDEQADEQSFDNQDDGFDDEEGAAPEMGDDEEQGGSPVTAGSAEHRAQQAKQLEEMGRTPESRAKARAAGFWSAAWPSDEAEGEQGAQAEPGQKPPKGKGQKPQPPHPETQLPDAASIAQHGKKLVAAIAQHDPEAAQAIQHALNHVIAGLRARQSGRASPKNDADLIESLKTFGRAWNAAAAPHALLGQDLAGLLQAADEHHQRVGSGVPGKLGALTKPQGKPGQLDQQGAQTPDEAAVAEQGAGGGKQLSLEDIENGTAPEPGEAQQAPVDEGMPIAPQGAPPAEEAPDEEEQRGSLAPPTIPGVKPQGPLVQPKDEGGEVNALGIDKDKINAQFGFDPKEQARQADAKKVLEGLNEQDKPESERALAEASAMVPEIGKQQEQRKKEEDAQRQYAQELSSMRASKRQAEDKASALGDQWLARQQGRHAQSVMRQQLGHAQTEVPRAQPGAATQARMEQGTVAGPKKGSPREEMRTAPGRVRKAFPSPSSIDTSQGGSAPRDDTPAIPDYQGIYYQPQSDERKRVEEEQDANRRRAMADRNSGVFGFHGTTNINPEPILHYVPTKIPLPQGPMLAQREPIVTPKQLKDRHAAGAARNVKGGLLSDVETDTPSQTDEGRVPRSPDRRDDARAPQDKRPSAKMTKKRRRGKVR